MAPWHRRRVHRLPGHDYSSPGAYFVTVDTHERRRLFGTVKDGRFVPNGAGRMIDEGVASLPGRFPHVRVDTSVVMPDHVHLILVLGEGARAAARVESAVTTRVESGATTPTESGAATRTESGAATRAEWAATRAAPTLGEVVGAFKSITTVAYIRGVRQSGWPSFTQRLWQRDYHDHVVRDPSDLARIRRYILDNPADWHPLGRPSWPPIRPSWPPIRPLCRPPGPRGRPPDSDTHRVCHRARGPPTASPARMAGAARGLAPLHPTATFTAADT